MGNSLYGILYEDEEVVVVIDLGKIDESAVWESVGIIDALDDVYEDDLFIDPDTNICSFDSIRKLMKGHEIAYKLVGIDPRILAYLLLTRGENIKTFYETEKEKIVGKRKLIVIP